METARTRESTEDLPRCTESVSFLEFLLCFRFHFGPYFPRDWIRQEPRNIFQYLLTVSAGFDKMNKIFISVMNGSAFGPPKFGCGRTSFLLGDPFHLGGTKYENERIYAR